MSNIGYLSLPSIQINYLILLGYLSSSPTLMANIATMSMHVLFICFMQGVVYWVYTVVYMNMECAIDSIENPHWFLLLFIFCFTFYFVQRQKRIYNHKFSYSYILNYY